jgi:hypothetical protein
LSFNVSRNPKQQQTHKMKRVLVASILGIAATVATYGQGVILFDNYLNQGSGAFPAVWGAAHPLGYNTGDGVVDTSIIIGLYAGAGVQTTSAGIPTLLGTTPIMANTDYPGSYQGGAVAIPTTLWTGTQTVSFQVRAVAGPAGLSWVNTPWQESATITSIVNPASIMANGPTTLTLEVPEPSTLALAGLGAAALLTYRRRQ